MLILAMSTGLPFAEPPVGALRFARAKLYTKPYTNGTFDAQRMGSPCIQNPLGDPRPPGDKESPSASEDCLNLNIYRPADAVNAPVMVWAFGGGLCGGYAGNRYYNGSALALRHGVIVVTVSYRIGALGFLTTRDDHELGSGGMNGINDVIVSLALKWNPDGVTVFTRSSFN